MKPTRVEEFDIVVLGAGIAGLLLASELSARHKVLVIEKQPEVLWSKYWLTDVGCSESHAELKQCVDTQYKHLDFVAHDQTSYRCKGDYLLWNTDRLLTYLKDLIAARGGQILSRHTFYSYRTDNGSISIFANDLAVRAKLAIDCMGYGSPIIYAKGVVDILGYYLLYGATFPSSKSIDPVGLHNLSINSRPAYVEAFPTSDEQIHLVLILPTKSAKPITSLREDFDFIINRSPYRHAIRQTGEKSKFLGGIIPVGVLRRQALDRLFFFGEAGQSNPAASATALTRMLYSYKTVASLLSTKLLAGQLTASELSDNRFPSMSRFDRRFQAALFRQILEWNSDNFLEVVEEMILTNNHELVNGILFGQASSSIFRAGTIKDLLRGKSRSILSSAARAMGSLIFDRIRH